MEVIEKLYTVEDDCLRTDERFVMSTLIASITKMERDRLEYEYHQNLLDTSDEERILLEEHLMKMEKKTVHNNTGRKDHPLLIVLCPYFTSTSERNFLLCNLKQNWRYSSKQINRNDEISPQIDHINEIFVCSNISKCYW